ncbi:hypothetical protein [Geovibrio thiophilus]|uniref:hypothetical protein n=1 Tax=Geovibrio thiophilus TaxID=139438 RepID=UPI001F4F729F|nr:hypothetical protein [Geovibrio thiophilus]
MPSGKGTYKLAVADAYLHIERGSVREKIFGNEFIVSFKFAAVGKFLKSFDLRTQILGIYVYIFLKIKVYSFNNKPP